MCAPLCGSRPLASELFGPRGTGGPKTSPTDKAAAILRMRITEGAHIPPPNGACCRTTRKACSDSRAAGTRRAPARAVVPWHCPRARHRPVGSSPNRSQSAELVPCGFCRNRPCGRIGAAQPSAGLWQLSAGAQSPPGVTNARFRGLSTRPILPTPPASPEAGGSNCLWRLAMSARQRVYGAQALAGELFRRELEHRPALVMGRLL